MSDMSIGAAERAEAHEELQAMMEKAMPGIGTLDVRMEAALNNAIVAMLADRKIDQALEDVEAERMIDGQSDDAAVEVQASGDVGEVAEQAAQALREVGDELVNRMPDIAMLGRPELNQFVRALIEGGDLDAVVDASAARLEQRAGESRAELLRICDAIGGKWPLDDTGPLAEHIETAVVGSIDPGAAMRDACSILGIEAEDIATAAAQAVDLSLDEAPTTLDVRLAAALADRMLAEQGEAAMRAIATDLEHLPENSQARKAGEALVAIAEAIPAGDVEMRAAVAYYYETAADAKGCVKAGEIVDRLLASKDDLLMGRVRETYLDSTYDGRVVDALSDDPVTAENARRSLNQQEQVREPRARRADPFDLEMPEHRRLAIAEAFDVVHGAIAELEGASIAVAHHAHARMAYAAATLELVADLRDEGRVQPGASVVAGAAAFQIGRGAAEEDTQAAHRLAGQLYIGADADELAQMSRDERAALRLDALAGEAGAEALAQTLAASTQVLPAYVNKLDSALEWNGMREALAEAASALIDDPSLSVEGAFEIFREGVDRALDAVQKEVDWKLEELHRQAMDAGSAGLSGSPLVEFDIERTNENLRIYAETFRDASLEAARERLKHHRN